MSLKIRYGRLDDSALIAALGAKTFQQAFEKDNSPQDIAEYNAATFTSAQISAEIADPAVIFLLAELDGHAVGYAKLNFNSAIKEATATHPVELHRLYALQEYVGKKIGAELMRACINEVKRRGGNSLWLGVWEHNDRAINFYHKWGFQEIGSHIFMLGSDRQTDLLMELKLVEEGE